MENKIIDAACNFIKMQEEADITKQFFKSYKCPAGVWTIGYGDTEWLKQFPEKERLEKTITQEFATMLLKERVRSDLAKINEAIPAIKNIQYKGIGLHVALLSMVFNLGFRGVLGNKSSMLYKSIENFINNTNQESAKTLQECMLMYCRFKDPQTGEMKVSKGLKNRRSKEAKLIENLF